MYAGAVITLYRKYIVIDSERARHPIVDNPQTTSLKPEGEGYSATAERTCDWKIVENQVEGRVWGGVRAIRTRNLAADVPTTGRFCRLFNEPNTRVGFCLYLVARPSGN